MDIVNTRHQSIFDATDHSIPFTLIGAGAIGSRIWLSLVELGITNITVWDFDKVEAHNIANQIYLDSHIGKPKVESLLNYYELKTGRPPPFDLRFIHGKFQEGDPLAGIVIMCVDTMEGRRTILAEAAGIAPWIVDTRMSSSYGDIIIFNGYDDNKIVAYEKTLFDDDKEVEVSACGGSISVGMTASIMANLAVWQIIHALTNTDALDEKLTVFLKPVTINTERLQ